MCGRPLPALAGRTPGVARRCPAAAKPTYRTPRAVRRVRKGLHTDRTGREPVCGLVHACAVTTKLPPQKRERRRSSGALCGRRASSFLVSWDSVHLCTGRKRSPSLRLVRLHRPLLAVGEGRRRLRLVCLPVFETPSTSRCSQAAPKEHQAGHPAACSAPPYAGRLFGGKNGLLSTQFSGAVKVRVARGHLSARVFSETSDHSTCASRLAPSACGVRRPGLAWPCLALPGDSRRCPALPAFGLGRPPGAARRYPALLGPGPGFQPGVGWPWLAAPGVAWLCSRRCPALPVLRVPRALFPYSTPGPPPGPPGRGGATQRVVRRCDP